MRILLHNIVKELEAGRMQVTIQFGDESAKDFPGSYDFSKPKFKSFTIETEAFFRLSELALQKFCNSAIYQMELMHIVQEFLSGKTIPAFPIELGTTVYGLRRPSRTKIFYVRLTRPFLLKWHWWKARHIRKANLQKYRNATKSKHA